MLSIAQMDSAPTLQIRQPQIPPPVVIKKNIFQRVGHNNRTLGLVFGGIAGLIGGILLVVWHQVSIAIIGTPLTLAWQVFTVILCMSTGTNLASFLGQAIDLITDENTIFDLLFFILRFIKKLILGEQEQQKKT